jgi:hypothetical protein
MSDLFTVLKQLGYTNPALLVFVVITIVVMAIMRELVPLVLHILKSVGVIKDPAMVKYVGHIVEIKELVSHHISNIDDTTLNIITMLKILDEKQGSYLTNSQVDVAIKLTLMYVQRELTFKFLDAAKNNTSQTGTIHDLRSIYTTVIRNVDRHFFQLPNTAGKIISTERKLACFEDSRFKYLDTIVEILYSELDYEQKKIKIELVLVRLTDYWYQTQQNEKN